MARCGAARPFHALIPFLAGAALARCREQRAASFVGRYGPRVVEAALTVVALVAPATTWRMFLGLGAGAWLTCIALAAVAVAVGHLAGGPARETRAGLAGFSAIRFPALAVLLTSSAARGGATSIPVVLAYVLSSGACVATYRLVSSRLWRHADGSARG